MTWTRVIGSSYKGVTITTSIYKTKLASQIMENNNEKKISPRKSLKPEITYRTDPRIA